MLIHENVDELDIDKFKNVPANLSNLNNKVDKLVDKLVPVSVDLCKLSDVVKTEVVKKMYIMLTLKISKKIPDITNLAITAALTAVENKLPNVNNLVKHCVESVQIRSYFWSVFPCSWTEYRKIRSRNDSVFGHFPHSEKKQAITQK